MTKPQTSPEPSPSKIAVQIMNITCGLCADPIHYHSFTNAASGWIVPTPRDLYIRALYKCIACHGRLGHKPLSIAVIDASDLETNHSVTSDMLHCLACGAYAHRTCAFARPTSSQGKAASLSNNSSIPICKINIQELERASYPRDTMSCHERESQQMKDDATNNVATRTNDEETNSESRSSSCEFPPITAEIEPLKSNRLSLSPWHIFRTKPIVNIEANGNASKDADHPLTTTTVANYQLSDGALEKKVVPPPVAPQEGKQPTQQQPQQQPGVLESSLKLIKKTTDTTIHIPTASAIGMVAGGAAGWALAGPAGIIVGSQIGRTVLTVGAVVEGGIGLAMLAMNLAHAANFSMSRSVSDKERELTLNNGALVLVRPDIEVDPIWGVYANEARNAWQRERNEQSISSSSTLSSSTTTTSGFALGNYFFSSTTSSKEEPNVRYAKDSDIVKADVNELPTRDKAFLLVNRILNDKTSLPGYQYRSLIMKHKRWTMFGDESRCAPSEESIYNNNSLIARSCRQDTHGIIKHVTATLLEIRPGLASSPAMTELTASAVEALIFGELYNECFDEIIDQTREKDECLEAKMENLRKRCNDDGCFTTLLLDDGEHNATTTSSISISAITALKSVPQAHTPSDKLLYCVEFLESVSAHYSSSFHEGQNKKCIDADTLLSMVCQHVMTANIPHLHAEIAFIEEFSRDEQLLSGKEGYALITLQASLHYLDTLDELPRDMSLIS